MAHQRLRINPHAQDRYNYLCTMHGISPTFTDIEAIKRVIGTVSTGSKTTNRFEPALLFFLPRSAVQFEEGALLIGWAHIPDGSKLQVWSRFGKKGALYHLPSGPSYSRYYPGDITCDEWHPAIGDIIDPEKCTYRLLQYAYLHSCIKLLQATVPPPSIENPRQGLSTSTPTDDTAMVVTGSDSEQDLKPEPMSDNPGSEGQAQDLSTPTMPSPIHPVLAQLNQEQDLAAQIEHRVQVLQEKMGQKNVTELKSMLEERLELPSWIKDLAKEILQKKMLEDLEMAEGYFLYECKLSMDTSALLKPSCIATAIRWIRMWGWEMDLASPRKTSWLS